MTNEKPNDIQGGQDCVHKSLAGWGAMECDNPIYGEGSDSSGIEFASILFKEPVLLLIQQDEVLKAPMV